MEESVNPLTTFSLRSHELDKNFPSNDSIAHLLTVHRISASSSRSPERHFYLC
ncbi:hypothetical protein M8C21_008569 [Ambrosia artemisiifolia]|uniref:Uncharacterized protein n=1 Tax=Ambrosia artemisiifolia TaxID=4212 RepID=A0AAD5BMW2_AMBAR|nr:hypothetical protein M8C21_008569 [Ambrosia artemisiifolia]